MSFIRLFVSDVTAHLLDELRRLNFLYVLTASMV
jgi:hypothetical protein